MNILKKICKWKQKEIELLPDILEPLPKAERDFFTALQKGCFPHVIAEIKPASPVTGRILPKEVDVAEIASGFEKSGVSAISVLTDEHFFQGSFNSLQKAKHATGHVPILCKDFILSEKQVRWARKYGADTYLLIVKILSVTDIQRLINVGRELSMEPLVEISDEEDLQKVLQTDAKIIGINNRDLRDFSVDLSRTFQLSKKLPSDNIIVSLSGFSGSDVRLVRNMVSGVLVGSGIGNQLTIKNYKLRITSYERQKMEHGTRNREQGTGNREHGTGNREHGTRNTEQGTGNTEHGTRNREQGTGNREQGTGNTEHGTRNREQGTGNREHVIQSILSKFTHPQPLVKCCGVRTKEGFQIAKDLQVPLLGLNFVPSSKRKISEELAEYIASHRGDIRLVGVFQNQSPQFVQKICSKYRLDFIQLSGKESVDDFIGFPIPIIKGISISHTFDYQGEILKWNAGTEIFLFDGVMPGSGLSWVEEFSEEFRLLPLQKPFLVAGGITPENAKRFIEITGADGVDTASGIEDETGEWSKLKISELVRSI